MSTASTTSTNTVTATFLKALKHWRTAHFSGALAVHSPGSVVSLEGVTATSDVGESDITFSTEPVPDGDGSRVRFDVSALFDGDVDFASIVLCFELDVDGESTTLVVDRNEIEKRTISPTSQARKLWAEMITDNPEITSLVDIGGRARSGTSLKDKFPGVKVTVADILEAPDVDIVGDVHELSRITSETFDAFLSIATFEHLIMPWKAAVEINRVLQPGGIGLVVTHQTVGVHEVPWDFFRFSDTAWKGIFNHATGFKILAADMAQPSAIIPHRWTEQLDNAERAAGFRDSAVLVRKIGEPTVDWDVSVPSITSDLYPH